MRGIKKGKKIENDRFLRTETGSTVSEALKPEFQKFSLKGVETRMKRDKILNSKINKIVLSGEMCP